MHAIHERDKVIAQALGQAFKAAAEPKIANRFGTQMARKIENRG
ncbi:hypothetical protein [Thermobispora bispora]|jgi:hypothetical protein|uniref:Uncharacterized protein n=1 Tax=Thermobispora bispora (strain ATCC 19993 / DSM 43833 / CBS 139.67 / JCM 10125 / KCTC 9307 / NBRC 14880 / R51) TaxID=469371 RepID=D6Y4N8_THEBD|nr:hypothetical protein [Thermobispora bispora]ADG89214.1 hypothetical protein Tbis_2512 [Thermobispora bispora DSM 43833]MDI9579677.1 hypothetical protein [Thermobispora sp.]